MSRVFRKKTISFFWSLLSLSEVLFQFPWFSSILFNHTIGHNLCIEFLLTASQFSGVTTKLCTWCPATLFHDFSIIYPTARPERLSPKFQTNSFIFQMSSMCKYRLRGIWSHIKVSFSNFLKERMTLTMTVSRFVTFQSKQYKINLTVGFTLFNEDKLVFSLLLSSTLPWWVQLALYCYVFYSL